MNSNTSSSASAGQIAAREDKRRRGQPHSSSPEQQDDLSSEATGGVGVPGIVLYGTRLHTHRPMFRVLFLYHTRIRLHRPRPRVFFSYVRYSNCMVAGRRKIHFPPKSARAVPKFNAIGASSKVPILCANESLRD